MYTDHQPQPDLSHRDHTPPHVWQFFEDDPEPTPVCTAPASDPAACINCWETCPNLDEPEPDLFAFPVSTRTTPPLYDVLPAVCASAARYDLTHAGALA